MTYSKDYLTKREAFKDYIKTLPVQHRKEWIQVLKHRRKTVGQYFDRFQDRRSSNCAVCVVGALRVVDEHCAWESLVNDIQAHRLNDYYRVPFSRFIKWIRDSLKEPVKS